MIKNVFKKNWKDQIIKSQLSVAFINLLLSLESVNVISICKINMGYICCMINYLCLKVITSSVLAYIANLHLYVMINLVAQSHLIFMAEVTEL